MSFSENLIKTGFLDTPFKIAEDRIKYDFFIKRDRCQQNAFQWLADSG